MIFLGSRYESVDVKYVLDPKAGETRPTVIRPYRRSTTQRVHLWRSGDRLDILSNREYGDPGLWWRIMDANPGLLDPNQITPGTLLRIP